MRKIIALLLLTSCTKSNEADIEKKCYRCVFGASVTGITPPPKDTCINPWDRIEKIQFVDEFNNDLNSLCQEK